MWCTDRSGPGDRRRRHGGFPSSPRSVSLGLDASSAMSHADVCPRRRIAITNPAVPLSAITAFFHGELWPTRLHAILSEFASRRIPSGRFLDTQLLSRPRPHQALDEKSNQNPRQANGFSGRQFRREIRRNYFLSRKKASILKAVFTDFGEVGERLKPTVC